MARNKLSTELAEASSEPAAPASAVDVLDAQLAELDQEIADAKAREAAGGSDIRRQCVNARHRLDAAKERLTAADVELTRAKLQRDELQRAADECRENLTALRYSPGRLEAVAAIPAEGAASSGELKRLRVFEEAISALQFFSESAPKRIAEKNRKIAEFERACAERRETLSAAESELRRVTAERDKADSSSDWTPSSRRALGNDE